MLIVITMGIQLRNNVLRTGAEGTEILTIKK